VKDSKNSTIISEAMVSISDESNNEIAKMATSESGKANFNVHCSKTNYTLNISKEGYESTSISIDGTNSSDLEVEVVLEPVNELITETEVKLKNIYFDFNKSNITQKGAFELDKLVKIMSDYPEMNILVKSHTDTKGTADYNLKLSERRAQATVQYVVSKGIGKERLSAKGMGSAEPKINCKSNCSEEENAQNRRSEFLIVKQ
jgi:outer membrane protein OmpA-like peptidoglycan-associated protein